MIARFEQADNNPGMSARGRLLELSFWFGGHAGEVVECYAAHRDANVAYATRSQLDSLFGATCDSVVPLVRQIASDRPIGEYDLDGHLGLFTKMIKAEAMAAEIGQMDQLHRRDVIAEIAEERVKHIAKELWERDADLKYEENRCINFSDFKKLLYKWINILTTRRRFACPGGKLPQHRNNRTTEQLSGMSLRITTPFAAHRIASHRHLLYPAEPDERVGKLQESVVLSLLRERPYREVLHFKTNLCNL